MTIIFVIDLKCDDCGETLSGVDACLPPALGQIARARKTANEEHGWEVLNVKGEWVDLCDKCLAKEKKA